MVTLLDAIHDILLFLVEDVVPARQHLNTRNPTTLVPFFHERELVLFLRQPLDVVQCLLVLDVEDLLTDGALRELSLLVFSRLLNHRFEALLNGFLQLTLPLVIRLEIGAIAFGGRGGVCRCIGGQCGH
jgi:hypothetical protein